MKAFYLTITVLFIMGCALSNAQKHPQSKQPSKVYVDSVKKVSKDQKPVLKIYGKYANGCTYLEEVNHSIKNGLIYLQLSARQNPDLMCTQALVPFSFIFDKLSEKEISDHSKVIIEGNTYKY